MLVLEAWFQWEIIANVPAWDSGRDRDYPDRPRRGALDAPRPWLYIAGLILLVTASQARSQRDDRRKLDELEEAERREGGPVQPMARSARRAYSQGGGLQESGGGGAPRST